jgi:hypothetical protein
VNFTFQVRGGYYTPFGLHHETDGRPYRAVTILLYLKASSTGLQLTRIARQGPAFRLRISIRGLEFGGRCGPTLRDSCCEGAEGGGAHRLPALQPARRRRRPRDADRPAQTRALLPMLCRASEA